MLEHKEKPIRWTVHFILVRWSHICRGCVNKSQEPFLLSYTNTNTKFFMSFQSAISNELVKSAINKYLLEKICCLYFFGIIFFFSFLNSTQRKYIFWCFFLFYIFSLFVDFHTEPITSSGNFFFQSKHCTEPENTSINV